MSFIRRGLCPIRSATALESIAVHDVDTGVELTYAALWQRVDSAATALRTGHNVRPGDRVAVFVEGGLELPIAWLAVFQCQASVVPMDANFPAERLSAMLEDCGANVLLLSANEHAAVEARLFATGSSLRLVAVESLEGTMASESLPPVDADADADADAEVYVIYTSGTTGVPKGVRCTNANLEGYCRGKIASHGIDAATRVLLACAPTWDPAIGDIASTLMAGAVLCVASRATIVHDLASALLRAGVTHIFATPSLWSLVGVAPETLPALRVVTLGGERVPAAMVAKWAPAVTLLNMYGVTEACVGQTLAHLTADSPTTLVGRALGEHSIHLEPGPDNVHEVWITGPGVSPGYLHAAPELTAARFVDRDRVRWVRTGDEGRWTADGQLEVLGRLPTDGQIKLRGFRVQLEGVESVLMQHELVQAAAAVLADDPIRLVVFVTLPTCSDEGFAAGGQVVLMLHCKKFLPAHEIPAQIVRLATMPLLPNGKINRRALVAPPPSPSVKTVEPDRGDDDKDNDDDNVDDKGEECAGDDSRVSASVVERVVAEAFQAVLQLPATPPPLAHFFELGGSSMTAVMLVQVICEYLADPQRNPTGIAKFEMTADSRKVRLCALQRKPRVHTYAKFLEWAAVGAPNMIESPFGARLASVGVANGDATLARVLADLDARVVADDVGLCSACMHAAADGGHVAVVAALLAAGAYPTGAATRTNRRACPLSQACVKGHVDVVRVLLKAGANPNFNDVNFLNSVHLSSANASSAVGLEILDVLLANGGVVTSRDINRWTPLHHAAWHGRTEAVRVLLRAGAPIDAKDRWSRTSLSWAVFRGHIDCVKILLDAGARHSAIHAGHRTMPQGAHQRRSQNHWSSLLQLAVQAIVERDADPNLMDLIIASDLNSITAKDAHGGTAIHDAAGAAVLHALAFAGRPTTPSDEMGDEAAGEVEEEGVAGTPGFSFTSPTGATVTELLHRAEVCFARLVPHLSAANCAVLDKHGANPADYAGILAHHVAAAVRAEIPPALTLLVQPRRVTTTVAADDAVGAIVLARYGPQGFARIFKEASLL